MFLVACKGTETPQEQPSLKVNPLALEFAASGNASQTLTVEAVAVEWTHEVSGAAKEWLTVSKTDAETLGDALLENKLVEGDEGQYGLFVTSVNGIKADYSADGSYWAFYIGDEYAVTGVDGEKLGDGSDTVYRLVYTK